ncbi:AAA ATPase domain protein [anaerobic digester metagenome]
MNISLENIGIIKDSKIAIDGLTVITGKNNSGKTTVGKTLYSLLDAVCNMRQKAENDRYYYIQKHLESIENVLEIFRFVRISKSERDDDFFADYKCLRSLISRSYRRSLAIDEIEDFAHGLANDLMSFDVSLFETNRDLFRFFRYASSKNNEDLSFANLFNEQKQKSLSILNKLFLDINKDAELLDYARESINQTLRVEFANQIQPVKAHVESSKVELSEGESIFFKFKIIDNKIVNEGKPAFISSPYRKVYLIDDPFILDSDLSEFMRELDPIENDTILNNSRINPHNFKLNFVLKSGKRPTVFEQTVLDESLKVIKAQIDSIIPGTFEFSSEGEYYIQNGAKLKISNLATGSKMFSIIKILLEKGEIDNTTMLILDEPEAHLHPMWQNSFAEIIALLVKQLKVNILLTTHSPNFMLALDAYMRKYDIADKTNFYQTDYLDDGFVHYHCVNDDMGKIYQDFLQYLSEMKMLRNQYLNNAGEQI